MIDLLCGDNVTELRRMPDECIDLTVTSPPYDNLRNYGGHTWDFENLARELYRVTKRGGVVVWVTNDATIKGSETGTSFKQALFFMECGFNLHDTMIYEKTGIPFPMHTRYNQLWEYMFVFSNGAPKTFNPIKEPTKYKRNTPAKTRTKEGTLEPTKYAVGKNEKTKANVWKYCTGYMRSTDDKIAYEHPAIFPDELARDHILSWSNEGDTVLDPFAGSGTTLKQAALLNRNAIGIEIHAPYIEIIKARLAQLDTAQTAPLFEV